MTKRCDWYRDDICDCFCNGLDANCENYSDDLRANAEAEEQIELKNQGEIS